LKRHVKSQHCYIEHTYTRGTAYFFNSLSEAFQGSAKARLFRNIGASGGIRTRDLRLTKAQLIGAFKEFCEVDLQLSERTTKDHAWRIKRVLKALEKTPSEISSQDIRGYLIDFKKSHAPATYAGVLKSLKVFFRDFLQRETVVKTFKFPSIEEEPKTIPSKEQLRMFYEALESTRDKALFLLFVTSGLRKSEVLSLELDQINFEKRMIIPNKRSNRTKRNWVSFFNEETEKALKKHIATLKEGDPLFPSYKTLTRSWSKASQKSGVHITPQVLRGFFSSELGSLGVPDRYVDAFCGRVPNSVLARHYTDYNPEKLKAIYDKTQLKVLSACTIHLNPACARAHTRVSFA